MLSNLATIATRDLYDWVAYWASLLLVAVGMGGIWVATLTLRKIERQTKAGEDGAAAALLNAESLINAERGRLIISFERPGKQAVAINVKNAGRTVVKATHVFATSVMLASNVDLPEVPIYVTQPDVVTEVADWINPTGERSLGLDGNTLWADLTNDGLRRSTRDRQHSLWVYGVIRYEDGITDKSRELRFCFAFWEEKEFEPIAIRVGGPSAYHTES